MQIFAIERKHFDFKKNAYQSRIYQIVSRAMNLIGPMRSIKYNAITIIDFKFFPSSQFYHHQDLEIETVQGDVWILTNDIKWRTGEQCRDWPRFEY